MQNCGINMKNKKGLAAYAWMFSVIIGALIIFLALFTAQKYIETGDVGTQSELVREFDILLNPFASVGAITTMTLSKEISMPSEVQMKFSCGVEENYNELNLRTRKGRDGWSDWLPQGFKMRDKYIFADDLEGENFWIFAKPLEMPWRVDDLIFIVDKKYCFEDPPENIRREVDALQSSVVFTKEEFCPSGSVEVCFGIRDCEVNVNHPLGIVKKDGKSIVFADDSLMYAAIFSDPETYECNFNRLINRLKTQIDINMQKAVIMKSKGCATSGLQLSLESMKSAFDGRLVGSFKGVANEVDRRNPKECAVF